MYKVICVAHLLPILCCMMAFAEDPPAARPIKPQIEGSFSKDVVVHFTYKYLVSLPPDYEKQEKWPLLLFLHGSGECGRNVALVKKNGPPKIAENTPLPFVLVSPQAPKDYWDPAGLNALLDEILAKYKIDKDRVYVTGLSLGGGGTWDLCAAYPDRFAAAIPVCGWDPDPETAERIKNIPFWVFHGDADKSVPLQHSKQMVEALKKLGAEPRFTTYPGVGHECWNKAYAEPDLWTWMLSQKKQR